MLEELSVADTAGTMCAQPVIDDDSLQRILKSSHKLRLLDVRGCSRVTGNSLVRLPAWDLEHLFLSGIYKLNFLDKLFQIKLANLIYLIFNLFYIQAIPSRGDDCLCKIIMCCNIIVVTVHTIAIGIKRKLIQF